MADVQVNVKVDAKQADDSFRGLTKQLKELRVEQSRVAEGSKEWKKLGKEINDLEGRLGDLGDRFNTLRGSGVERLNSSFGLLREGLVSADFGKAKIALQGIGQAMKAIPILLIVTGVMKLIENFDKLRNSGGLLGKVFTAIGEGIDWVVEKLETFADFIRIIDKDLMDMGDALKANIEASTEALAGQISEYDRQIEVASIAGQKTIDLEIAKQKAIIDTNTALIKQTLEYMKQGQELTKEEQKILSSQIENLKNATTEIKVLKNKEKADLQKIDEEREKDYQKHLENLKKIREDAQKEILKGEETERANQLRFNQMLEKEEKEKNDAKLAAQIAQDEADLLAFQERKKKEKEFEDQQAKQAEEDKKRSDAAIVEADAKKWDAMKGLTDAFFMFQLNAARGNADKELEIRKKMFAVDKAFNVARAVQDGIRSVQAALTIPPPGGQILAVVNAALAAGNVAKILATKFDGGSSGAPRISTPNLTTPSVSTPTPQQATLPGQDGTFIQPDNKVYVLESDITKTQGRVARVGEQAKF